MNHFLTSYFSRTLLCVTLMLCVGLPYYASASETPTTNQSQLDAKKQLDQLMHDYFDLNAKYDPVAATLNGDNRFDDKIGMNIRPRVRAKHLAHYRKFQKRLHKISSGQLSSEDQLSYHCLEYELHQALTFEPFPDYLLPINQMDSVPVTLAIFASGQGSQPLTTPTQYRAYLNRLRLLPTWINQAMANMRIGIKTGVVLPQALVKSMLPQFTRLVSATPQESIFYTPIKNLPDSFSNEDKNELTAAYENTIAEKLTPSLVKLATFLEKDYLPAARLSTGWSALPNGEKWYLTYVANTTTTTLQPDQIHAIGLKEVARIQEEFATLGPKLGYTGPAAGLPVWVAAQDKFYPFKSGQEILDVFTKLNASLDAKLPALFTLLPKAKLEVRLEPELTKATAASHYTSPNPDGTRPGIFWAVVDVPTKFISTDITTLFLHEGRPGHHFQIALQQELPLPEFRKHGYNTAYTEGWALYAETLGREMGLYEDPAQYFGTLNLELLRAVRLVVDTGMHAKGWTREQSIHYMRDTLGYSEADAKSATERYMALPGQALGYKIGALKIAELRQKAKTTLGAQFNLPEFHAIILDQGNLPMSMLEEKVNRWISTKKVSQ